MNKQHIKNISNGHYKNLIAYSKNISLHCNAEAIHRYRVEYKKLRAFLRMMRLANKADRKIKLSKKIKQAYRIAGSLRDVQLVQQTINHLPKHNPIRTRAYISELQKEQKNLRSKLRKQLSAPKLAECKKKTVASLPAKFTLSNYKFFIQKNTASVSKVLASGVYNDSNIHTVRKLLKDLFYNANEYPSVGKAFLLQRLQKGKKEAYFKTLLHEMGDYQDQCTAIKLLGNSAQNKISAANKTFLTQLKRKWTTEKTDMKKKLVLKLKALTITSTNS